MTFTELKSKASFHELLLIDAAIKAYEEMMVNEENKMVVHTAKKIAKDYGEIMMEKISPHLRENPREAEGLRRAVIEGTEAFNYKYGIE